jgi:hypothetical protein
MKTACRDLVTNPTNPLVYSDMAVDSMKHSLGLPP